MAVISITDADKGPHDQAKLEIISGNAKGHFQLQQEGILHFLRVSSRARFQRGHEYNLTLKAIDIGGRSSISSHLVKVREVNEHRPSFTRDTYEIEVSEDILPGSSVIILSATDQDPNADLTYQIANQQDMFKIHSKSGMLTTKRNLDRESADMPELKIKVTDGVHDAYTDLLIRIQDVNDEKPKFQQDTYQFVIEENFPIRQTF